MRIYGRMETMGEKKMGKIVNDPVGQCRANKKLRNRRYFRGKNGEKKPHDYPFILCTCETFKNLRSQTEFPSGKPSEFMTQTSVN